MDSGSIKLNDMWYKEQPDGTWSEANKVYIPAAPQAPIELEFNHNASVQGWFWSDTRPQGFLDWAESVGLELN